ncbi:MAG: hypothetical protein U5K29_04015 [Acidimicrobiales bacterium]|nr:hypothetical protein [Acidimicrobiales bacterium]
MGKGMRWASVRESTNGMSHAELVKAAETAAKRSLLAGDDRVAAATLVETLSERNNASSA